MNPTNKAKQELYKSIQNHEITIYSGVYTTNKIFIVKELIKHLNENDFNCIVLNFGILNLKRYYSADSNYEYIKKNLNSSKQNIIIIFEFTNCEEWISLIEKIQLTKNTKILVTTSINFSTFFAFSKIKQFRVLYNEIIYYPPTYLEFTEMNPNTSLEKYLENGSITIHRGNENDDENMAIISEINILRLFSIFLITTKVRNYFQLEMFFTFLIENIDQKLTLDFIKRNINKKKDLMIRNIKSLWKYINLLQALYIIVPINTYSLTRRQQKINSKFVCIDHMLFKNIHLPNKKKFLITRNIIINEFIKRGLEVLILENQKGLENGFIGISKRNTKYLFIYTKANDLLLEYIKKEGIDEENIHFIPNDIKNQDIEKILKMLSKNLK